MADEVQELIGLLGNSQVGVPTLQEFDFTMCRLACEDICLPAGEDPCS